MDAKAKVLAWRPCPHAEGDETRHVAGDRERKGGHRGRERARAEHDPSARKPLGVVPRTTDSRTSQAQLGGLRWTSALDPETVDLLREIADAGKTVPRDKREFMVLPHLGGCSFMGPGDRTELSDAERRDIDDLLATGLLRVRHRGRHEYSFTVTPEAYAYLASLDERDPLRRVEAEVTTTYMEAPAFRAKYPLAYQRWKEAADLLWGPTAETELTTIGHKTREAVQEFASALVDVHRVAGAPADAAKTVARLQAVVDAHRGRLGEARRHLLDALIVYWGEVNDLLQRQEHGGQKERESLGWEDGRRAVFHTAIVMYEIDRTI